MTLPSTQDNPELKAQHQSMWQLGAGMIRAGRWPEATEQYLRIVELFPTDAAALVQAAYLLSRQDRYRQAHTLALGAADAVSSGAVSCDGAVQVGKLLRLFEESERLQALFAITDWTVCRSAHLLAEASRLLMNSGLHVEALAMIDRAVAVDPGYAHGHYMRGSILAAAGEQESANEALCRARVLTPNAPHVHWMLSWQPSTSADAGQDDSTIAELKELVGKSPPGSDARAYLGYALHNRLHRLQRFQESWKALECAMQAKRQATPYKEEVQRKLFAALRATDLPQPPATSPPPGNPRPIFIVGMHRSGTTLLEHLLAGHSTVADGGETYMFTACLSEATDHQCSGVIDFTALDRLETLDWNALGDRWRGYARWRASGRAALTEKLPSNFLSVGMIARALPEARFLHMRRDPVDVCFSNLRTFFGQAAAYSYDQQQLAAYYLEYQGLMAHWHAQLPGRILDIDYAGLVQKPVARMRGVMAFCGLPFEPGAMEAGRRRGSVATASLADVRGGISKDRGGAWKPYASGLQPLIEALKLAYGTPKED